jgi:DNA-binding winged helix-turn-helix (wHTH) protein
MSTEGNLSARELLPDGCLDFDGGDRLVDRHDASGAQPDPAKECRHARFVPGLGSLRHFARVLQLVGEHADQPRVTSRRADDDAKKTQLAACCDGVEQIPVERPRRDLRLDVDDDVRFVESVKKIVECRRQPPASTIKATICRSSERTCRADGSGPAKISAERSSSVSTGRWSLDAKTKSGERGERTARESGENEESDVVARFGSFTFDSEQRLIQGAEGEAHLTPKAFDLLCLLIRHAPRVVSKAEIHTALWPDTCVSDSALVVVIKEIRRALDDRDTHSPIVRTFHRVGYAFRAPLDVDRL